MLLSRCRKMPHRLSCLAAGRGVLRRRLATHASFVDAKTRLVGDGQLAHVIGASTPPLEEDTTVGALLERMDGDVHMLSNHKLNALGRKLIGPAWRGAVDANGLPKADGKEQQSPVHGEQGAISFLSFLSAHERMRYALVRTLPVCEDQLNISVSLSVPSFAVAARKLSRDHPLCSKQTH